MALSHNSSDSPSALALGVGVPLGLWVQRLLFDVGREQVGFGPGFGVLPSALALATLVSLIVSAAFVGAYPPAEPPCSGWLPRWPGNERSLELGEEDSSNNRQTSDRANRPRREKRRR